MEAALHITIQRAGDPEKLGELLKAALATQDQPVERSVVPTGYRCVECYADDGGHERGCTIAMQVASQRDQNSE